MKRIFIIFAAIGLISGCATSNLPQKQLFNERSVEDLEKIPEVSLAYKAGYDTVWNATILELQKRGPIQILEKENGKMATSWYVCPRTSKFRECFVINLTSEGEKTNVSVRRILQEAKGGQYHLTDDVSVGPEKEFLLDIEAKVEEMIRPYEE